jgi:uncharacterized protein (DUF1778 family)
MSDTTDAAVPVGALSQVQNLNGNHRLKTFKSGEHSTEYNVRTEDDVMPSTLKAPRSRRLNLRTSAQQEKLMRRGAQERGESLTDFIVRSACAEAEQTLADQRRFSLDADQWNAFVAALDRPAQAKPRLRRLLSEPSVLEQQHS